MRLSHLMMHDVLMHYRRRVTTSDQLIQYLHSNNVGSYVHLALGLENAEGNYSAWDHKLGDSILSSSPTAKNQVFKLAKTLIETSSAKLMLDEVYKANISYLKVSVGSEMAMLLQPQIHWVANVRTVWAYLLVKHDFDYEIANEALSLYRDNDRSSLMNYQIWSDIHLRMKRNLLDLGKMGIEEAERQNVAIGEI